MMDEEAARKLQAAKIAKVKNKAKAKEAEKIAKAGAKAKKAALAQENAFGIRRKAKAAKVVEPAEDALASDQLTGADIFLWQNGKTLTEMFDNQTMVVAAIRRQWDKINPYKTHGAILKVLRKEENLVISGSVLHDVLMQIATQDGAYSWTLIPV